MTHTKDKLAAALFEAGLDDMAAKAAAGWYDDFLSPLATPCLHLVTDLQAVGGPVAMALAQRVVNGEFDSTREESEAWAASPEGQETMRALMKPGRKFRP